LGGSTPGGIEKLYLDFRNATNLTGEMLVDLSPSWNVTQNVANPDLDADGMPDAWELQYFRNTFAASGSSGSDFDHDGFSDLSEFLAQTNPTNAASRLALYPEIMTGDSSKLVLTWPGASNKTYTLLSKQGLSDSSWTTNQTGILGVYPLTSATTDVSTATGFLRIRLEP
jgi:hypothetical protein